MEKRQIASNKQVKLEIEMILNRKLFQSKVINREVYEEVQDELLKEINKELERVWSKKIFFTSAWSYMKKNYIIRKILLKEGDWDYGFI